MPVGLYASTDNGDIQIDQDTKNFVLKQKGTVVCNTTYNTGGVVKYRATVVVSGATFPILAIKASGLTCVYSTQISGTTWTFHIVSLTANQSVDYYVFDQVPVGSVNFGLEVYTADGKLAYGADESPLRLLNGISGASGSWTAPTGRTLAIAQTNNGYAYKYLENPGGPGGGSGYQYIAYLGMSRVSSNTAVVAWDEFTTVFESYPVASLGIGFTPQTPTFLVIDVTNY